MSDFLAGLAERAVGEETVAVIRPRPVSRFERQALPADPRGFPEEPVEVEGERPPLPAARGRELPRFADPVPRPRAESATAPVRARTSGEGLPLPARLAEDPLPAARSVAEPAFGERAPLRREPGQAVSQAAQPPVLPPPPLPPEREAPRRASPAAAPAEALRTIVERLVRDEPPPAPASEPDAPAAPARNSVQPRIEVQRAAPRAVMPRSEERAITGESVAPQPVIHVSIGRIEVRAAPPSARPAATPKASPAPPQVEPLEEYLRNRRARP